MNLFQAFVAILLFLSTVVTTEAQFGVPRKAEEAAIDANGNVETENPYAEMAIRLQSVAPIDIQDAVDIAAVLEAAKADPDTQAMIAKMKQGEEGKMLEQLSKEITPMEIVNGLKQSLDEMKALEALFADPERAVSAMAEEGLIEKKRLDFYKQNPQALEDDTRRSLYFGFVSMAAAGGYLN